MKERCDRHPIRLITKAMIAVSAIMLFSGCKNVADMPEETAAKSETKTVTEPPVKDDGPLERQTYGNILSVEDITLDPSWKYAENAVINTGHSVLYRAAKNRKNIVVAVNAGHGTIGGDEKRVYCHPDGSPKLTDGTNPKGSLTAVAVSVGMIFDDGTYESKMALLVGRTLRDMLLEKGYDVLMIRNGEDVQLDNVARTVIANNKADILVSLHFDGDGQKYDKGCFYVPVPDEIKELDPVSKHWQQHEKLGKDIVDSLGEDGCIIYEGRVDPLELTQTCYATIPSVVVELGNAGTDTSEDYRKKLAAGLCDGIVKYLKK